MGFQRLISKQRVPESHIGNQSTFLPDYIILRHIVKQIQNKTYAGPWEKNRNKNTEQNKTRSPAMGNNFWHCQKKWPRNDLIVESPMRTIIGYTRSYFNSDWSRGFIRAKCDWISCSFCTCPLDYANEACEIITIAQSLLRIYSLAPI